MSSADFAGAAGFVQFDPKQRLVNGQTVTDVVIKAFGSQKLISVTLWPEMLAELAAKTGITQVNRGDLVAADGSFSSNVGQAADGSPREYLSISPTSLVVTPGVRRPARQVVQAPVQAVAAVPAAAPVATAAPSAAAPF